MKVTENKILALYNVVRLVNSCHINIAHNSVERIIYIG